MTNRIRPFSQGTQYLDWNCGNCCTCARYHVAADGQVIEPYCDLEEALSMASILDGTISPEIANRLGVPQNTWSDWRCKEHQPIRKEHQPIRKDETEFHKPAPNQAKLPFMDADKTGNRKIAAKA